MWLFLHTRNCLEFIEQHPLSEVHMCCNIFAGKLGNMDVSNSILESVVWLGRSGVCLFFLLAFDVGVFIMADIGVVDLDDPKCRFS